MKRAYDAAFAKFMGESIYRYACVKDSERVRELEKKLENLTTAVYSHGLYIGYCGNNNCSAVVVLEDQVPLYDNYGFRGMKWHACCYCMVENEDDPEEDHIYCSKCYCPEHEEEEKNG